MSHIRFFNCNNVEKTFLESIKLKSHWLLIGPMEQTRRQVHTPIPLRNILTHMPKLDHTAWLIVSLDQTTLYNESFMQWIMENILNNCTSHLDILFLIQPEDPLLSMERVVNDQTEDLEKVKNEYLPYLANSIQKIQQYRNRYYYLFVPDIFTSKYQLYCKSNQQSSNNNVQFGSSQFLQFPKEIERYYYAYKYALESVSEKWLALVVGWTAPAWFHIFSCLSTEQKKSIEDAKHITNSNTNSQQSIYCDLDWTPEQFVSVLIK